jgi:excisionase family DNA binding protein
MNPLDRLVARETFQEAIHLLTPRQLAVALLRLEGLTDDQIARLLGIQWCSATKRIRHAAARIASEVPELRSFLRDRRQAGRSHTLDNQPLEHGWLCTDSAGLAEAPSAEPYLSTGEAAALLEVHPNTIVQRCRQGRYSDALRDGTRWRIPTSAIQTI